MKRYEKYKESSNEFDEDLPLMWSEKRVKDIFNLITDIAPANNNFELLSLYASIGVRPRKEMQQRGNKSVTTDGYWIVKKGDIIVNKLLAWMGAIGLSEYEGVTSPAYDVLRKDNNEIDERFYTYLFRTEKAQAIFKKYSRGIMEVRLRLYFDKFGAITVPFPPCEEQKQIADYLDRKTAEIDRKIDLLTQKANKYEELKKSLINQTVTRGLDKSVAMKDSGIEWIGKIPKHWEISHIKRICRNVTDGAHTSPDTSSDDYPFLTVVNLKNGVLDFENCLYTSKYDYQQLVRNGCQPKLFDVLYSKDGTISESIAIDENKDFVVGSSFIILSPIRKRNNSKYLSYLLSSSGMRYQASLYVKGASLPRISIFNVAKLFCVIPPLPEQKAIARYLDEKTAHCDKIITTINQQIEKLKELRKTLINDVVTGKIKVTDD